MKKILTGALIAALTVGVVFAGGIDAKTNLNVGYLRNPSRNTESVRPEAALYNIAGTAFMADGLYLDAGDQFIFKTYSHEVAGTEYKDEKPVFLFPNFEVVYKHGKLGFFGTFHVAAGGGSLEYKDGSEMLPGAKPIDVYSVTFGQNLGVSYAINDMVSVSGAVRLLEASQTMETTHAALGKIGYEASGFGVGGIFGVNVRPIENLDLSFQYKSITKMECEIDSNKGSATALATLKSLMKIDLAKGNKYDADLSPEFNFGAGYKVIDPLYVSASFNYYFNKQADMGSALSSENADYDDSWEVAAGADYAINEKVGLSCGLSYSKQGFNDDNNNMFSPVLDSLSVGLGAEIKPITDLTLTIGGMYAKYFEEEFNSVKLNKTIFMFALGATYRFGL